MYQPLLAVFVTDFIQGATISIVGFSTAFYAIVKSIIQVPAAKFLDKQKGERDDFYVMIVGAVFATISTYAYALISEVWHLYMVSIGYGISAAFLFAAYYSIFSHHVDEGAQGFEWSLFSVGGLTISSALGGAVGGVVVESFGFTTAFIIAGTLSLIATILLFALYPLLDGFRPKGEAVYVSSKERLKKK